MIPFFNYNRLHIIAYSHIFLLYLKIDFDTILSFLFRKSARVPSFCIIFYFFISFNESRSNFLSASNMSLTLLGLIRYPFLLFLIISELPPTFVAIIKQFLSIASRIDIDIPSINEGRRQTSETLNIFCISE